MSPADSEAPRTVVPPIEPADLPPQDGALDLAAPAPPLRTLRCNGQHSGVMHRPIDEVRRDAVAPTDAQSELEQYKLAMRKYAPVQKGRDGLPWTGQWHCPTCNETVPGDLTYDTDDDAIYLDRACPRCGPTREYHEDVLFVKAPRVKPHARQPASTFSGSRINPILPGLPRTVETLCPECSAIILGRNYAHNGVVYMEKTCPEHGYFRDRVNTDVKLYLRAARAGFQDERGVHQPQVTGAGACPSDCGLCNQHHSTSCLAQIDMTNRCNLNCPVCFASANSAGYVAEPNYDMIVEMLRSLRAQKPHPATAIQFTGGEPTLHPEFCRVVRTANDLGFSHVQIATNGIRIADRRFAEQAAEAGLHTLYMQFDGLDDEIYRRVRGVPLLEKKLQAIENCREFDLKVCLVPTIIRTVNEDQVSKIFRFAAQNADVISAISYQPVAFTGRISLQQLNDQRYTLGDLAHAVAACSGADLERDFFPLNFITPLSRIMQVVDGKPKIRSSCHSDCAFGTYFFVTPDGETIPIPKLFNIVRLMKGFNELADRVERTRPNKMINWRDKLDLVLLFLRSYRWTARDYRVTPLKFIHALRGMTNKHVGRGNSGQRTYRTLMAAGMHFMDRYNYDTERIKRCVILYSTPDGMYPFCTINGGPTYRPFIERMHARPTST